MQELIAWLLATILKFGYPGIFLLMAHNLIRYTRITRIQTTFFALSCDTCNPRSHQVSKLSTSSALVPACHQNPTKS